MKTRFRHSRFRARTIRLLAVFIVFFTTYSLILPAITLDQDTAGGEAGLSFSAAEGQSEPGEAVPDRNDQDTADSLSINDTTYPENTSDTTTDEELTDVREDSGEATLDYDGTNEYGTSEDPLQVGSLSSTDSTATDVAGNMAKQEAIGVPEGIANQPLDFSDPTPEDIEDTEDTADTAEDAESVPTTAAEENSDNDLFSFGLEESLLGLEGPQRCGL